MARYDYDIGVIGGGAAGLTVAAGAARFGAKVLLVEKSERLGGDCLHTGCVPSKTLIKTAKVLSLARRSREFGLPCLEIPEIDLGSVMDRVQRVIDRIQAHDSPERFCGLGVKVLFGNASFVDGHTVEAGGERISARSWVLSTGSSPAIPPVEGLAEVPYWTNETVFSQRELPEKLIVLGGGPVGIELAQSFQRLGSMVTVVEFMDQILGAEDSDVAGVVRERLLTEGMELLTSTKAVRAQKSLMGVKLTVSPSSGGEERFLEANALLVATGRKPNVGGLNLEAAGVGFSAKGVPADARLRTNIPHIYACGDVNGVFPFTHVAGYEGGIALTNSVLHLPRKADYGKIPWCTFCDPEVASVGLSEKRAIEEGLEYRVLTERFAENDRALAESEAEGFIKVLITPRGKLLGCQIVGASAGELIHEWILAVSGGAKLSTIAGGVHVYPTLSEISKRAMGSYYAEKLFSERTKSLLTFLFNLKGRGCELPEA
ncbi:FAD-dependent oxidoreductase [bacterium]|nr:MAG: FAD-dependent oxidoreductase [bacterium]